MHDGIFFKFPNDDHGYYGGLNFANKSAAHELIGVQVTSLGLLCVNQY